MKRSSATPIRRLDGITYRLIEGSEGIYDFVTTEIRKEREADTHSEHRDPTEYLWLKTLSQRKWNMEIAGIDRIRLNPDLMNYVDLKTGYNFSEHLAKRSHEPKQEIETYDLAISPSLSEKKTGF